MGLRSTLSLARVFILFTLLILLSCGKTPQTSDPLNGTKWILQSLYGRPLLDSTIITLEFSKGYVRGQSGCNYFGGINLGEKYKISDDGGLAIPSLATTMRDCFSEEIMGQEKTYIEALHSVAEYRLIKGQLELTDGTGNTILVFANQSLTGLPYLVFSLFAGGIMIYLWWFLLKKPAHSPKAG